jgi:SusD family
LKSDSKFAEGALLLYLSGEADTNSLQTISFKLYNMKNILFLWFFLGSIVVLTLPSCFKDLDTEPIDPDIITASVVYKDTAAYRQVLAKLYAGFALSGQQGPSGQPDISGIDEGFGQYLRGFWYTQELTTDEAVIGWNDQTIKDFHAQTWTANDGFLFAFYSRVFYQIALANEYLRETTDAKLDARAVSPALKEEVKRYRAEARFLRALSYWHALDLFRNTPFATEDALVGSFLAPQTNGDDLYTFIESELKAIESDLVAPRSNEYARADQAAAWMLLAKLTLNAEVYTGQNKAQDCLDYCKKIINAGYTLEPEYKNLFLADNHNSKEIIFPVAFDGINTQTWGGMTFIIRAGIGGGMPSAASGVAGGWGGSRTTRQLVEKFPSNLTGVVYDFNLGATVTYNKLYMPGTHQGNDATQTSNSLSSPLLNKIYYGYRYFPVNTELRFTTIPSNSAPKIGDNGANGSLETGGAAIKIPAEGFYYMEVNLNTNTYKIEPRAFSVFGTATGNQDIPLTFDAATGFLQASGGLVAGTMVFRANNGAGETLGDTGANGIIELGGAPIVVATNGGYTILLDIDRPDYSYKLAINEFDRRAMFYSTGQSLDINDLTIFTDGYAVNKFKNITSTGQPGKSGDFPDTDFPMFRLADAYLMAAEAVLRGAGGGDKTLAAGYFNQVRARAYSGASGNVQGNNMTLDLILDERARELYWEGHRRTDLVRFGQFTDGSYLWQWKGGVKDGATVGSYRNIFPIPASDLNANPNLKQNLGY